MTTTHPLRPTILAPLLAAACFGGAMLAAHAQEPRAMPQQQVLVPQALVQQVELTREERRQLRTRNGALTAQQRRNLNRAGPEVSNRELRRAKDAQGQLNRQEAIGAQQAEESRRQALKNMQSGG